MATFPLLPQAAYTAQLVAEPSSLVRIRVIDLRSQAQLRSLFQRAVAAGADLLGETLTVETPLKLPAMPLRP